MREALAVTLAAAACVSLAGPARGDDSPHEARRTVQVSLANRTPAPIRCVAVLAHFVTRDLGPAAPGERLRIRLERGPDGALAFGRHGASPMFVENLLCGTVTDWQRTARDVPLQALRSGPGRSFVFSCTLATHVVCAGDAHGG